MRRGSVFLSSSSSTTPRRNRAIASAATATFISPQRNLSASERKQLSPHEIQQYEMIFGKNSSSSKNAPENINNNNTSTSRSRKFRKPLLHQRTSTMRSDNCDENDNSTDANDNNNNDFNIIGSPEAVPHFTTQGDWHLVPNLIKTHYSSMCFDGSQRIAEGRSTLSPTVETHHPAVSPPLLRAQQRESPSIPMDVAAPLAQEYYDQLVKEARETEQQRHFFHKKGMMLPNNNSNAKLSSPSSNNINHATSDSSSTKNNNNLKTLSDPQQHRQQISIGGETEIMDNNNHHNQNNSSSSSFDRQTVTASSSRANKSNNNNSSTTNTSSSSKSFQQTSSATTSMNSSGGQLEPQRKEAEQPATNSSSPTPSAAQVRQSRKEELRRATISVLQEEHGEIQLRKVIEKKKLQQQELVKTPTTLRRSTSKSPDRSPLSKNNNNNSKSEAVHSYLVNKQKQQQTLLDERNNTNASASTLEETLVGNDDEERDWVAQGKARRVHFHEWDESILKRARDENKILFVRVVAPDNSPTSNHGPPAPAYTVSNFIVRDATDEILNKAFIPVLLNWNTDAELCDVYHKFLQKALYDVTPNQNLEVREDYLVSQPEAAANFDVFVTFDGAPIQAYSTHMLDTTSRTVLGSDVDGWTIPKWDLQFLISVLSNTWKSNPAHLLQLARENQNEISVPVALPRKTVSRNYLVNTAVGSAINDFRYLFDNDPEMTWRDLTSKPATFTNGLVPLFVDAQQAFLENINYEGSPTGKQFRYIFDQALGLCKAGEEVVETQPLDSLAEGAWLTLLIRREMMQREKLIVAQEQQQQKKTGKQDDDEKDVEQEEELSSTLLNDNKWIITLKQRLLARHLAKKPADRTISRDEASSAALVKVVQTLSAHAAVLAAAVVSTSSTSSPSSSSKTDLVELKTTLRLASWIVQLIFERARSAKSTRTTSIDAVHGWSALLHLMKNVGYNQQVSKEVLQGCAEGLVEALRPLTKAWDARAKLASDRERAQRVLSRREIEGRYAPYSSNPFAKKRDSEMQQSRKEDFKFLQREQEALLKRRQAINNKDNNSNNRNIRENTSNNDGVDPSSVADLTTSAFTGRPPRIASSRSSSSWFTLAAVVDEMQDIDDAFALASDALQSANENNNYNSASDPCAFSDEEEKDWMIKILTNAVSLPIGLRDSVAMSDHQNSKKHCSNTKSPSKKHQRSSSSSSSQKEIENPSSTMMEDKKNKPLWRAANMVWAGAPKVDRSETLSNALRSLDILQHTFLSSSSSSATSTTTASTSSIGNSSSNKEQEQEEFSDKTRKNFINLYFSLRQLAAIMLTAQSRKSGDCLALHGQIIGACLTASTSPTVAVAASSSSLNNRNQSNQKPLEAFTLADFGAFTDRSSKKSPSTLLDATVQKFLNFFECNRQVTDLIAESTCLSLSSQVIPFSVSKAEDLESKGAELELMSSRAAEEKERRRLKRANSFLSKPKSHLRSNSNKKKTASSTAQEDDDYVIEAEATEQDGNNNKGDDEKTTTSSYLVYRGSHICDAGDTLWERVHFQYFLQDEDNNDNTNNKHNNNKNRLSRHTNKNHHLDANNHHDRQQKDAAEAASNFYKQQKKTATGVEQIIEYEPEEARRRRK